MWLRDLRDRFRGMRGRLLLLVFVVLLPMLLVQVGIYLAWYDSQRDGEDADNLEMAGAVAVAFSTFVDDLRRQEMAVGQALLAAEPFAAERANAVLTANAREYPSVQAFHWADPGGVVIASGVPAGVGLHTEDREYFRQIEGGAEWVLNDLLRSHATEAPAFFVARAIHDPDGPDLAGILIAEVAPDRLDRLAMDVQRGQGAVAVFDRRGRLVFRQPYATLTDACAGVAGHGYREGRFRSVASARAEDEAYAGGVRLGAEFAEACMERMQSGESIRLSAADCERQFGPLGGAGTPHGLLAARLVARGGHASGAVVVTDHRAGGFTAEDEALLRQLPGLASLALQHVAASEEATARSEELARSDRDLEQFAYVASHDLQEPLRMVTGYLQLLQRRYQGRLDADADEFIGYAVDGARMQSLIQDLLAFSCVGTRGKAFQPTDLNAVMREALSNLARVIEESDALVAQDEMPTVCADPTQMVQLFQNLIGNAIKFRDPRRRPEVHVGCRREEDRWALWARDNGIGLEPRYAERAFVIFQRLHGRDEYPGTGIGLAICKKIAERHGGRIWVESTAGEGAMVYLTLPDRGHAA